MSSTIASYLTIIAFLVTAFDSGSSRNLNSEFYQLLRDKRSEIRLKKAYLENVIAPLLSEEYRESNYVHKRSESGKCNERSGVVKTGPNTVDLNIRFPSVHLDRDDSYLVTAHEIPSPGKESYIVKFTPHANMDQTHHMLVYGCPSLPSHQPYWRGGQPVCNGQVTIYAWARNAPELVLPKDVGYRVGGNSNIKYIAVQMHFATAFKPGVESCAGVTAHITTIPQKYYAGIFLLASSSFSLKPNTKDDVASMSCANPLSSKITVFGFRTHAHSLAKVISGYRVRSGQYHMIGKGNPKWPQSFYPRVGGTIDVVPGDWFAGSCVYDNPTSRTVFPGPSSSDEMCNFYMMFYTENRDVLRQTLSCWNVPFSFMFSGQSPQVPQESLTPAPYPGYAGEDSSNAIAAGDAVAPMVPEEHAHGHHHDNPKEEPDEKENQHQTQEDVEKKESPSSSPASFAAAAVAAVLQHVDNESEEEPSKRKNLSRSHGMPETEGLYIDNAWLRIEPPYQIGAVGGLVADKYGNLHVFHRAGRIWNSYSFDGSNRFLSSDPIKPATLYKIDNVTGKVVNAWGAGMFYMPHGISLDKDGNMWLTDVGMHQVFKFPPEGSTEPLITLGQKMVPGSDVNHFCKPSDVAIDDQGLVYVADGYCNGRVMKFDQTGNYIKSWGRVASGIDYLQNPLPHSVFAVVHNIIMCGPTLSDVCIADRENGRIQIFDKEGNFLRIFEDKKKIGRRLFAITYSPSEGGLIYGVNGPSSPGTPVLGFTIKYSSGNVIDTWEPGPEKVLTSPHDITTTCDGKKVFVGELTGEKVYKFNYASSLPSNESQETIMTMPAVEEKEIKKDNGVTEMNESLPEEKQVAKDVGQRLGQEVDQRSGSVIEEKKMPLQDSASTIIITILVALPTVAILTAFVCVRMRAKRLREYQGLLSNEKSVNGRNGGSLNLGKFLQRSRVSKKGFTMVQGAPSDEEDADVSDSDVEVYSKAREVDEHQKNSGIANNQQPRF